MTCCRWLQYDSIIAFYKQSRGDNSSYVIAEVMMMIMLSTDCVHDDGGCCHIAVLYCSTLNSEHWRRYVYCTVLHSLTVKMRMRVAIVGLEGREIIVMMVWFTCFAIKLDKSFLPSFNYCFITSFTHSFLPSFPNSIVTSFLPSFNLLLISTTVECYTTTHYCHSTHSKRGHPP